MDKFENHFAKILSYIFHPVFLPLYCLLLLLNIKSYFTFELIFKAKLLLILFVSVSTIFFPLVMIFLMKKQGLIKSYQMNNRQERIYPYIIVVIFYFLTYNLFRQMQLPDIFLLYMLGATLLLLIVIIINIWWKISTHMVGIGGVLGLVAALMIKLSLNLIFLFAVIILLAGLIGFARLKLNSHKPLEIYAGLLAGIFIMLGIFCFF